MLRVMVCVNRRQDPGRPSCAARGSLEVAAALEAGITERGLAVKVKRFFCLGECERGVNLRIAPAGTMYNGFSLEDVPRLLDNLAALELDTEAPDNTLIRKGGSPAVPVVSGPAG